MTTPTLSPDMLRKVNANWRAANYVSVGQIYLSDNPLLKRPLEIADVKPLIVSHWGTTPGQNFIYLHLNRVIKKYDLDMFYIAGPGHGGPAIVGNVYLEGTWSDVYPTLRKTKQGSKSYSSNSPSRAAFPVTWRRPRRARSTKGAKEAIP